jgi:hypothetical protein
MSVSSSKSLKRTNKLKTERNESRGFGLMCLDGSCMVETEFAAIAGPILIAFFNAAILGDQCSPDISKLIRGGVDSESSIIEEGAKVVTKFREGHEIKSLFSDILIVVVGSKVPEFDKDHDSNRTAKGTNLLVFSLAGVCVVVVLIVSCIVISSISASGNSHILQDCNLPLLLSLWSFPQD